MPGPPCPVLTCAPCPAAVDAGSAQEIRTYRLSGRRWIYNQLELSLQREGSSGTAVAAVEQAAASNVQLPVALQESGVAFLLHLDRGVKVQAHIYCCHADAEPCRPGAAAGGGEEGTSGGEQFAWRLVTRQQCCKGCQGPVLRAIQRFGRVGKRQAAKAAAAGEGQGDGGNAARKDPRFMYLSLDEACTHVGATAFRLVAGIYNRQGTRLLGTAVSPPIRSLANNDAPTGAAHIRMEAVLPSDWEGWSGGSGSKRRGGQAAQRQLKRPSQADGTPQQPLPGLRTPTTSDKLSLLDRPATISRLPAPGCTFAHWQLPFPPAASSAPPRLPVSRQLSLPGEPPSPLALGGHGNGTSAGGGGGGGDAANAGSRELGAWAADALCAVPPAELAAQLAPSLPFYSSSQAAAEREAERQLSLLQQLKSSIAAATQPSASSCGSPFGLSGGGGATVKAGMQTGWSHPHLPALAPAYSVTLPLPAGAVPPPIPTNGLWLYLRSHSLDTSMSAATAATHTAAGDTNAAGNASGAATGGTAATHSGAGRHAAALGSPAATCHSPMPLPPEMAPGLGGGGLELGRCCGLDGDLELEAMHSLMSDSHPSGMHVDLAPLLDDMGLSGL